MKTIRILILEDDLLSVSTIIRKLSHVENMSVEANNPMDFSVVTLSEYTQVEKYINKDKDFNFDIVLLDRDCKIGGSFHTLDIEKFGPEKIISISSIHEYNAEAKKRGVNKVVYKDYQDLEKFADKVIEEIRAIIEV